MSEYAFGLWEILAWAWRQEVGDPTRKLILIAIVVHADSNGYCWPTTARLGSIGECSARTARRHVDELVKLGMVRRVERFRRRDGSFAGWLYQLTCCDPSAARPGWGLPDQRPYAATGNESPAATDGHHQRPRVAGQELSKRTTNEISSTEENTSARARTRAREASHATQATSQYRQITRCENCGRLSMDCECA